MSMRRAAIVLFSVFLTAAVTTPASESQVEARR
jgi:hypothetical protein